MMTMNLNDCAAYLKEHDGYGIVTHIRPDGDTLGCAAALCHTLRRIGKKAAILPNPQLTETYRDWIAPYEDPEALNYPHLVAVDIAAPSVFPIGFDSPVDLCIDHHPSNTGYAARTYCVPEAAACGEIIMELCKVLAGTPDMETATYLYVAISTDTGCFVYGNTTADSHRAAAELMDLGLDVKPLNVKLFRTSSYARLMLESRIYSNLRRYHEGMVNVAIITRQMMEETGAREDDCEDLASLAGKIDGNRISVTIRELEDGESKVSMRSWEFFDSNAICTRHGGGGHRMAAGFSMKASPEAVAEMLVREIEEALA